MLIIDAINSFFKVTTSIPIAKEAPSNVAILDIGINSHDDYQNKVPQIFNNDEHEIPHLTTLANKPNKNTKEPEKFQLFENIRYASAFGEAFRFVLPNYRRASYALGTGYILKEMHVESKEIKGDPKYNLKMGDKFITKMLSCVVIPAFIVQQLVCLTHKHTRCMNLGSHKMNRNVSLIAPMLVGLIAIPIILIPIEKMVNFVMDYTYRAVLEDSKPKK